MDDIDFSTLEVNANRQLIRYGEMNHPTTAPSIPPTSIAPKAINVTPNMVSVNTEFGSSAARTVSPCLDKTIPRTVKSNMNIPLNIFSGILKSLLFYKIINIKRLYEINLVRF